MGVHLAMALIGAAKQATSVVLRSQTLTHSGYRRLPQVRGKDLSGLVETGLMRPAATTLILMMKHL